MARQLNMTKIGLGILAASIALSVLLLLVWLIGVVFYLGGSLIHLLLVLSLIVGCVGSVTGIVLIVAGKARGPSK